MSESEELLKLDNQLCFSIYTASRAIIRTYKPLLDRLEITYTQYITLLVLWEQDGISVNKLGKRLLLDSGTLTPLLKKMEKSQLLIRERNPKDERQITISLTEKGKKLKEKALEIPEQMLCKLPFDIEKVFALRDSLKELNNHIQNNLN